MNRKSYTRLLQRRVAIAAAVPVALTLIFLPVRPIGLSAAQPPDRMPGPIVVDPAGPYQGPPTFVAPRATTGFSALVPPSAAQSTFIVTYNGFSPEAQAAFQAAVDIWAAQIRSAVPIRVTANWTPLSPGILGSAGATYIFRNFPNGPMDTWIPSALADKKAGFDLAPGEADIEADFNSAFPDWYFGTDGNAGSDYDFMTVVLHELGHGLGFFGSMTVAGGIGGWGFSGFPMIYDRFAVNGSIFALLNTGMYPNPSVVLGTELTSNNVYFIGTSAGAANGGSPVKLYAPAAWQQGSSYSHVDEATYPAGNPNSLMTYAIGPGEAIHDPGPVTKGILTDIGWMFANCSYRLSATNFTFGAAGGSGSINVSPGLDCEWTAVSDDPTMLTVTSGASGTNNGTVVFSVSSNAVTDTETSTRIGRLTVAGQTVTVTQTGCSFVLTPENETFGAATGTGSVGIDTPSGCRWTVSGLPAWAATLSGSSGTGSGVWEYSVQSNSGSLRAQGVAVAGQTFTLTQLDTNVKGIAAGSETSFTLANENDARWTGIEAIAGRSYCARLSPAPDATEASTPTLTVFRADAATQLASTNGFTTHQCFIAPASETILVQVTQSESSPRPYELTVVESTLRTNWFFTAGSYSSFTLLRNTTSYSVDAVITWRNNFGTVVATTQVTIAPHGIVAVDAKTMAPQATSGTVQIAHDGEPHGIIGSQTTLSAAQGLSFDTLLMSKHEP